MRVVRRLALAVTFSVSAITGAWAQQPTYLVFFQQWSAAIDDSAQSVINQAADWMKSHPGRARVIGFADPTGSREANILLSELRAQVVSDGLVAAGVPAGRIRKTGKGSVQFAGSSQEARRVEIDVTP